MQTLDEYERRFRRAGLPLLIEDYSATEDIFNRAAPLLALVFIGEMLGAIDLDWTLLENLAAAFAGLAILVGAFAVLNRLRHRRLFAVPETVGIPELAGFVVLPAALPAGGQEHGGVAGLFHHAARVPLRGRRSLRRAGVGVPRSPPRRSSAPSERGLRCTAASSGTWAS